MRKAPPMKPIANTKPEFRAVSKDTFFAIKLTKNRNLIFLLSSTKKQEYKTSGSTDFFRILSYFSAKIALFGKREKDIFGKNGIFSE